MLYLLAQAVPSVPVTPNPNVLITPLVDVLASNGMGSAAVIYIIWKEIKQYLKKRSGDTGNPHEHPGLATKKDVEKIYTKLDKMSEKLTIVSTKQNDCPAAENYEEIRRTLNRLVAKNKNGAK